MKIVLWMFLMLWIAPLPLAKGETPTLAQCQEELGNKNAPLIEANKDSVTDNIFVRFFLAQFALRKQNGGFDEVDAQMAENNAVIKNDALYTQITNVLDANNLTPLINDSLLPDSDFYLETYVDAADNDIPYSTCYWIMDRSRDKYQAAYVDDDPAAPYNPFLQIGTNSNDSPCALFKTSLRSPLSLSDWMKYFIPPSDPNIAQILTSPKDFITAFFIGPTKECPSVMAKAKIKSLLQE